MLLVDWLLVEPRLRVKPERLVSARSNQTSEINLCLPLVAVLCITTLLLYFLFLILCSG